MTHDRIEIKLGVMGGKPVIKGTRISVEHIVRECSSGQTHDEIVSQYSYITLEDVRAALAYAADHMRRHWAHAAGLDVSLVEDDAWTE